MPFISQDWRGPGEDWVKVDDGWEIRKVSVLQRDGVKRRRTKTEGDRGEDVKNAVIRLVNGHNNKQRSFNMGTSFSLDWRGIAPSPAFSPSVPS